NIPLIGEGSGGERIGLLDHIGAAAHRIAARKEHEAPDRKAQRLEPAGFRDKAREVRSTGAAQPCQRYMGYEFPALWWQPRPLQHPLLRCLEPRQFLARLDAGIEGPWLVAAETAQMREPHRK